MQCIGHHCMQINTNNVNKTRTLLQTSGGTDEPNIVPMRKSQRTLDQGSQRKNTQQDNTKREISATRTPQQ